MVSILLLSAMVADRSGHAQEPPRSQPAFRAEVNLVEVVAVVTDETGRSLGDLAAPDFEVVEDGEPRTLVSVRKLSTETRETANPQPSPAASASYIERLATSTASADAPAIVMLLDDLDTSRRDAHRVIRAAEQAFAVIPPGALVSVVTTSGLGGSIVTLEPPGPRHIDRIRAFRGQLLVRAITPGGISAGPPSPLSEGMSGTPSLDTLDPTRSARRASTVAATAEILGRAGSRRKVLLWVTQTMGVQPEDPQGSQAAQRRARIAALANDVAVYVLDPRGNPGGMPEEPDERRTGGVLRAGGSTMPLDVDDMAAVPLTQLTRETGGRYVTMANNYGEIMGQIIEQSSTSYLLVYESPVSRTPGAHRIDVRVKRPGARVSARRGYIVEKPAPGAPTATAVDDSLMRRTLLGSAPQGQLQLTVHAVPRFAKDKRGAVSVTVRADAADGITSPLDVVFATFDDEGQATNQHQVRLEPPAVGKPLEFSTELPLSRGRHQLRVAAVTADATKTGLVITPVEVIEPGRQLVIAPPLVLQEIAGQVLPTAARRFASGASLGVQAEIAGRPVQDGKVAVTLHVADSSGKVVRTTAATLDASDAPDRRRATGVVDTAGLAAGTYLLTLEATPGSADSGVRQAIPIRLDAAPASTLTGVLRHSVVAHGPTSRHRAAGTFVIRDEATWREFWSHLPTRQAAPEIDFSRVTLFAIVGSADGEQASRPEVVSITNDGGATVVTWRATQDAAALSQPFTVVGVTTPVGPVKFERPR